MGLFFWKGIKRLRIALVCFYLKSFGVYLYFLNSSLADAILFSLSSVSTFGIAFLTCLIFESFTWGWDEDEQKAIPWIRFCELRRDAS